MLEPPSPHPLPSVSAELDEGALSAELQAAPTRPPLTMKRVVGLVWWGIKTAISTLFGLASLIVMLAVVAAVPGPNFYVLGYLLEVEGRVGRSGRFRDAFPLLSVAPKLGSIALGIWLWLIPLRLLSHAAADARLIDPGSPADRILHLIVNVLFVAITSHICMALARGGSLSCFFRPIKNARWLYQRYREHDYWTTAETAVVSFVKELRPGHASRGPAGVPAGPARDRAGGGDVEPLSHRERGWGEGQRRTRWFRQ